MNHNFADWELTQLLPERNPYNESPNHDSFSFWYKSENKPPIIRAGTFNYADEFYIKDAWTWEDIRLYLENKGYILKISPYVDNINEDNGDIFQILYYYDIIFSSTGEVESDFTYYHTYEEARKEAIIYCLNQINNEQ